jgi:hypothetical protein
MAIDLRFFKRSDFKPGTWVKVSKFSDGLEPRLFQIIDISRGGVGLYFKTQNEFKVGEKFFIFVVGDKVLETPLKFEVLYILPIPGPENLFRAGCEFLE